MSLASLVADHRIVVCVGTGGVGKTTVAASLALHGAICGRRAMVLTIDPARRLAQSLGLHELHGNSQRIDLAKLEARSVCVAGSLSAGMLDQKSAWDDFIGRHAPNEEACRAILRNEFYQQMSRSFAGSTEYMAIEELCRIHESGEYDLIVLDTPPTGHALDFLEAPRRLEEFLDRSMIGWFVKPYASFGWSAWKTASRTVKSLFNRIERATGVETLRQISEFFVAMDAMFDGITERSRRVRDLLTSARTAFVLVAGPDEQVLGQSESLTEKVALLGMPLRGVILNRIHSLPEAVVADCDVAVLREKLVRLAFPNGSVDFGVLEWLVGNHAVAVSTYREESERFRRFAAGLPAGIVMQAVPEFAADVHDLEALALFAEILCGENPAFARLEPITGRL